MDEHSGLSIGTTFEVEVIKGYGNSASEPFLAKRTIRGFFKRNLIEYAYGFDNYTDNNQCYWQYPVSEIIKSVQAFEGKKAWKELLEITRKELTENYSKFIGTKDGWNEMEVEQQTDMNMIELEDNETLKFMFKKGFYAGWNAKKC